jgi:hypothetical protein
MARGGERKGAGRKRLPFEAKRVPIAMRVSPACADWLRDQALKYDCSLGQMVENMMHLWREHERGYESMMSNRDSFEIERISDGIQDIFRIK